MLLLCVIRRDVPVGVPLEKKNTGAGHSLYLPGGSRAQYDRHIHVRPSQGSNPRPSHQTANALTTELWRPLHTCNGTARVTEV